jgi:hypothetical protein
MPNNALLKDIRIVNQSIYKEVKKDYCEYCGTGVKTHIHHIKTRGAGGGDIKENLINLCPECHTKVHAGNINRFELVNIIAKRENKTLEEIYQIIKLPIPDKFPEHKDTNEPSLEELIQAYISLNEQEADCRWEKGQIISVLVQNKVKTAWISSQTGDSPAQIRELAKVYNAFPDKSLRIPVLSWFHHRLAANTDNPQKWIKYAADNELSTRELNNAIKESQGKILTEEERLKEKAKKIVKAFEDVQKKNAELGKWIWTEIKKRSE